MSRRFTNTVTQVALNNFAKSHPTWTVGPAADVMSKSFSFTEERDATDFCSLVANVANKYNGYYPELQQASKNVNVKLWDKEAGGISNLCVHLAEFMDKAEAHVNWEEDF